MDKFEIIKNFLLDESVSPEIRRERFDIAWDIWENFPEIQKNIKYKFWERYLKPEISLLFPHFQIEIASFDIHYFNISLYKTSWLLDTYDKNSRIFNVKLNRTKNGCFELGLEKWKNIDFLSQHLKALTNEITIKINKFNKTHKDWLFREIYSEECFTIKQFLEKLIFNPENLKNFFIKIFKDLNNFLNTQLTNEKTVEQTIEGLAKLAREKYLKS